MASSQNKHGIITSGTTLMVLVSNHSSARLSRVPITVGWEGERERREGGRGGRERREGGRERGREMRSYSVAVNTCTYNHCQCILIGYATCQQYLPLSQIHYCPDPVYLTKSGGSWT
jgi:hypothetical protein